MLYKFKSKAAGDVIMTESAGDQILRIIGKEPAPKGIIEVSQMTAAIMAIEEAIAAETAARQKEEATAALDGQTFQNRGGVSLQQRGWPMLEMLREASGEGHDIVWGV